MGGSDTPLCLVCYRPMSVIDDADVPMKVIREVAYGIEVNRGMAEATGWIWCPDCGCYSHLPTILRLLRHYRDIAQRASRDIRKMRR